VRVRTKVRIWVRNIAERKKVVGRRVCSGRWSCCEFAVPGIGGGYGFVR
jgi:hypothetical protein